MAKRRSNNEGSISHRKDGLWMAQVTVEDKRITKYYKTQKEAREWVKKTQEQVDGGLTFAGSQTTVAQYLLSWLETIQTTIRPMTLSQYDQVVNQYIIPGLGKIKLNELRPDHIQTLYNAKLKGGMSERSVFLLHTILHRALNIALRQGMVIRNSADAVIKPKMRRKEMKVLDDVQARNLLLAVRGTGFEAFFQLEITTGLRIGELFGLKWPDLDVTTRMLQIRRQVQRLKGQGLVFSEPKTAAGRRNVTIGPTTLKMLQQHYKDQQIKRQAAGENWTDNGLIFPNTVGNPLEHRNVLRFFKEMLTKAGLAEMRFHDLRHTAATLMLKEGINPKVVQERLGHADISLTLNTYSHVLPSMQDDAAGKLDDLMNLIEVESELTGVEKE